MKIKIKESQDNNLLSQTEHVNLMLNKLSEMLAEIKENSYTMGADICALDLIKFRNGVDNLINELAFAKA